MHWWVGLLTYLLVSLLIVAGDYETIDYINALSVERPENTHRLQRYRRIISGHVAETKSYPYIVSIQATLKNGFHSLVFGGIDQFCGGTLIKQNWILTAAHCFYPITENGEMISLLNATQWHLQMATDRLRPTILDRLKGFFNRLYNNFFGYSKLQTYYHISKIILHPEYTKGVLENDIALCKVREPVLVQEIDILDYLSLPTTNNVDDWPKVGQICTTVGWGCACATCAPEMFMQELKMPIIGPKECRSMYKAPINLTENKEFCAGFHNGNTGICPGDSGGPLVCDCHGKKVLAGIVSATHGKKPETYPAVFTRVSFFTDWINSTIYSNQDDV